MKYLIILATLLIFGCASRKVNTNITTSKSDSYVSVNDSTEQKTTSTTKISDTTSIFEITLEPIDNTKEIIVDGKRYSNVRIKTLKTKKGLTISNDNKSVLKQIKHIEQKKTISTKEKVKETKTSNNSWVILIGVIFMMIIIGVIIFCEKVIYK